MFFITFTCPVGLLAAVGRLLATLPRDRCGPSLGRRGGAATSKNRPDTTPPLKKTWILMINACTLQLMRTGTRSRAHGAASGRSRTAPRPHLHGTYHADPTPECASTARGGLWRKADCEVMDKRG